MQNGKQPVNIAGRSATEDCIGDELLLRYFEGTLSEKETKTVQRHLNSCPICFQVMASLVRNSVTPFTEAEKQEVEKLITLTPEEQVDNILKSYAHLNPSGAQEKTNLFTNVSKLAESVREAAEHFISGGAFWRPAMAWTAIVLMTLFVGKPYYLAWRSEALAASGISSLTNLYAITARDEPRPTGGFKYEEFGMTRDDATKSRYEPARMNLEKALQLNRNNSQARHYLGTYFLLIRKDFDQAQEQYLLALTQDSTNAFILNDLGLVAFYKGDYEEAAAKFSLALQYDAQLLEAQYNLATLYQHWGRPSAAAQEWEKYLRIETESSWAEVAKSRVELLQQR